MGILTYYFEFLACIGIISNFLCLDGVHVAHPKQSDWTEGISFGLLAPATYVFFASVVPALTFGEQIADHTGNMHFGGAQVLLSTAICGIIQSVFGGQPLLIVGVAEPIILVYTFMYEFCIQQE